MGKKNKDDEFGKKCIFTGKSLKRSKRYYRNGQYFLNKNAFKAKVQKELEEAKEANAQS